MQPIIGTGFCATEKGFHDSVVMLADWCKNVGYNNMGSVVIVDNSETGLVEVVPARTIRIKSNLGHMSAPARHATRFAGWSISWMIPALIAYSEGRDFIYKEQDCFAFGDWMDAIRCGDFTVGRNSRMPCEQSLFFIRNNAILRVLRDYQNITAKDSEMSTEEKFMLCGATFHPLGCGRDRPLTPNASAWYAQRLTQEEMSELRNSGLV